MKKIIIMMFAVITTLSLTACNSDEVINTWSDIEERGYVIVGLDDAFAPMGFRDEDGELTGFDVDLAKAVFDYLDIEVRFQPIDWNSKVLELNSGNIDMIWNGLTITDARLEEMSFSDAYLANTQMVMVKAGSTIDALTDLSGLDVAVQISSAAEDAVNASEWVDSFNDVIKFDTYNQALLELTNGTVDAVVIDEIMGRYIMSLNPDTYEALEENFGAETYGIGFRLEATDIKDVVNQALLDLIANGEAATISNLWFDEDILLK